MWFIKKFNHDPSMFKLRIRPLLNDNELIQFEYTANGGLKWKPIYCSESPFLGSINYDWGWQTYKRILTPLSNFDHEKEMFSSYQKILDYEAKEKEKMIQGQREIINKRQKIAEQKNKIIKEFNK